MPEPFKATAACLFGPQDQLEQPAGALPLAYIGCMDYHRQDQPQGIDQQVTFAAVNFLDGVIAAFGSALSGRLD